MSKVFLIDLTMQWSMLKKHCDQNIGPLNHAFTLQSLSLESIYIEALNGSRENVSNQFCTQYSIVAKNQQVFDLGTP